MSSINERDLARVFSALGDPTRVGLLMKILPAGALSATALAEGQSITRQAVVKHLQVLESADIVAHKRRGREVIYEINREKFSDAQNFINLVSDGWDEAFMKLKSVVENE
ncbi:ArsR/SmtB family transcription factor [Paracoccus sp. p3-h83]|uniref:ArsR/SmtB family transcription factor n=1 Tax=Paracoccus sp. p3-h83 TaxID=3342805 RepID=UPI0035BB03B8